MDKVKKGLVLLSGGLDSTVTLSICKESNIDVHAMTFDYGQRHKVELDFAKWQAKKFNCNKVSENKFSFKENYVENTYSSCDQNKRVISILNLDAEHVWPETGYIDNKKSIYIPYGYCATDIQSYLGYQKCETTNDNSVTEFLITKLFEFKI